MIAMDRNQELKSIRGGVTAPEGFMASGVTAGIKKSGRPDLAVLYSAKPCSAAVVATTNKVAAAPVYLTKDVIKEGRPVHAVVINSGNANACTGEQGRNDALAMVAQLERSLQLPSGSALINSTGIIGHPLPIDKILSGIEQAAMSLSPVGGAKAAQAILTTDSHPKEFAVEAHLGGKLTGTTVKVGGMAKGAGMIAPSMATMIAVITTDAEVTSEALEQVLFSASDHSFNQISVDGCMSTNDMVILLANGASAPEAGELPGGPARPFGGAGAVRARPLPAKYEWHEPEMKPLKDAIHYVCSELAKMIARDGEGATKLIDIEVTGAHSDAEARRCALAIVSSDLVKCAFFGNDPNWGRILASAGAAGVDLDPEKLMLDIEGHKLVVDGAPTDFDTRVVHEALKKDPVHVTLDLGIGTGRGRAWGCDMTYDYVKINAEYTT